MRKGSNWFLIMHWKQGQRLVLVITVAVCCVMVLWLVSYNRTQVIVSLPHSLSGEGSLRSGQDDEEVFSGKPEDVKSDMDLTNAIRALRKKYRAYYLETFRLMLKSRLKWKPDSKTMDQLLEKAKEYKASPDQTLQARKTSLEDRMKQQKKALEEYCGSHNSASPHVEFSQLEVSKHLLYDDKKKIIFCYVPKVGCSNWKRMFVVLNGILPPTESTIRPPEDILRQAKKLMYLKRSEQEWRLKEYFKFTMLRNPLERIISAYRNKVPLPEGTKPSKSFPSKETFFMLQKYEPEAYKVSIRDGKGEICPKFQSFLQFLTYTPPLALNEHYRPFIHLCQPCSINYDLFTNFKYLPDDAFQVMDKLEIPHHYYLNTEQHPSLPTSDLMDLFYGTYKESEREKLLSDIRQNTPHPPSHLSLENVPRQTLVELLVSWKNEIDFYNAIFPEDKDNHLKYLLS